MNKLTIHIEFWAPDGWSKDLFPLRMDLFGIEFNVHPRMSSRMWIRLASVEPYTLIQCERFWHIAKCYWPSSLVLQLICESSTIYNIFSTHCAYATDLNFVLGRCNSCKQLICQFAHLPTLVEV